MVKYVICLLFMVFTQQDKLIQGIKEHEYKRLLLSDPNVIQQRLLEMEDKIQNLTAIVMARLPATERDIHILKAQNTALEQSLNNLASKTNYGGSVYVRWGRKTCPGNDTELVYSGYTGGSFFSSTGAAANFVCMPSDPLWGNHYDDTVNNNGGRMFGAEYQDDFFGTGYKTGYDDVPCSVCRNPSRSTHLMIPGRNQCYAGWKKEYSGNLASGHYTSNSATQFICVDDNPEVLPHGSANDNGRWLLRVEGICGSLACPPYVNGRELTCAVCTK